jgi:hypothetical protein
VLAGSTRRPAAAPAARRGAKRGAPPPAASVPAPAGGATAMLAALAFCGLLAWNGATLVGKIETMPFELPMLRSDATVDRARIALQVREGLAAAALVPGERLVFWSPSSLALEAARGGDAGPETYWERNVRSALFDGVAVRVLFPQVGGVEFAHAFRPGAGRARWALYAPDGRVRVMTGRDVEAELRAGRIPP